MGESIKLEETRRFGFTTTRFSSGAAYDATGTPVAIVIEDGVALVYAPTVEKIAATTGLYCVPVAATAANGFEVGKSYSIYVTATVDGVAAAGRVVDFAVRAVGTDDVALASNCDAKVSDVKLKTDLIPAGGPAAATTWTSTIAGRIDASISTRSSHSAADVWASTTRTLTSYGTLAATTAAAVWDYLTSALTTAGSVGAYILAKLATPTVVVTSPLATDGETLTIYPGDAYDVDHARQIDLAITGQPTLAASTVTLKVWDGGAAVLSVGGTLITVGTGVTQTIRFELTAAQTALLTTIRRAAYSWQVHAAWAADTPTQPAVIAGGNVDTKKRYA